MCSVRIISIVLSLTWLFISQFELLPAAQAQDALWHKIGQRESYIFFLRPTVYKDYLNFPGQVPAGTPADAAIAKPLPIVKVSISYAHVQSGGAGEEIPYESLWYRGSEPLGCRRYKDFNTQFNYNVYAYLSSCSSDEQAACANALVRLYLDMILNRHQLMAVEVPGQNFWDLVGQLEIENFYVPNKLPAQPAIYNALTLVDVGNDKQTVIHYKF